MMRLDHIGIAVSDAEYAKQFYGGALALRMASDETWNYRGIRFHWTCFDYRQKAFKMHAAPEELRFGVRLELMSSPDANAFTNLFIARRGEGVHHLTFEVEEIDEAVKSLRSSGVKVREVDTGDLTWKIAIIEPDEALGMLVILAQYQEDFWMYPSREGPVLQNLYGATGP